MKEHPDSEWKELTSRKDEFLHILRILNHYYEMQSQTKNELYLFRRNLVERPPEQIRIFFSKIGTYEFFVSVSQSLDLDALKTWLHMDGIAEERERFREIGNMDHPVFSITCLSDLFENATEDFHPELVGEKKVAKGRKKIKL
jgi:hypothetical protein